MRDDKRALKAIQNARSQVDVHPNQRKKETRNENQTPKEASESNDDDDNNRKKKNDKKELYFGGANEMKQKRKH